MSESALQRFPVFIADSQQNVGECGRAEVAAGEKGVVMQTASI